MSSDYWRIKLLICCTALFLSWQFPVMANPQHPITFYLEDEPIYTSSSTTHPGFLLELLREMTHLMGIQPQIKFLPWKRAQQMASNTPNGMIFPLTRTEKREDHYRWIVKIFDVPVMFINRQGRPVISSIEQARKVKKIGVITGTPQEDKLMRMGFLNIASVKGKYLYEFLARGRVDAIYTAGPEAVVGWRVTGYPGKLQFGEVIQTLPLWLAASKNSPLIDSKQWADALEKTKSSSRYSTIYDKYYAQ
ncbi:substrate-binding periplasmic protein [Dongshaea marina]|uniref:substrate-binding periplasmic protein n=1 Tax=Dongshaea marina TaxID=2047966 RepID=UPI000D3E67CD|nr:transporter substrate-binding domain-containing protein [Dongshaea marina]